MKNKDAPKEIWTRDDGWQVKIYNYEPLQSDRTPLDSLPDGSPTILPTYEEFINLLTARGYELTRVNTPHWLCNQFNNGGWAFRYRITTPFFWWLHNKTCDDIKNSGKVK